MDALCATPAFPLIVLSTASAPKQLIAWCLRLAVEDLSLESWKHLMPPAFVLLLRAVQGKKCASRPLWYWTETSGCRLASTKFSSGVLIEVISKGDKKEQKQLLPSSFSGSASATSTSDELSGLAEAGLLLVESSSMMIVAEEVEHFDNAHLAFLKGRARVLTCFLTAIVTEAIPWEMDKCVLLLDSNGGLSDFSAIVRVRMGWWEIRGLTVHWNILCFILIPTIPSPWSSCNSCVLAWFCWTDPQKYACIGSCSSKFHFAAI